MFNNIFNNIFKYDFFVNLKKYDNDDSQYSFFIDSDLVDDTNYIFNLLNIQIK